MSVLLAIVVFIVVAVGAFVAGSLLDQRNARARLMKERLATVQKPAEREPDEELAILRDEMLSQIPALDTFLRRSERVSAFQKTLSQAGMQLRAGNFLMLCAGVGVLVAALVLIYSRNPAIAWAGMFIGFVLPYSFVSYRRNKRFEKFEELFPEAIDTLARAVRAGHAFTTALELIASEIAEPVASEFRKLYEEQKFGLPVRDALINLIWRQFAFPGLGARRRRPSALHDDQIHGLHQGNSMPPHGRPLLVSPRLSFFHTGLGRDRGDGIPQAVRRRVHGGIH